jgi:predicted nucleotide-binding protein
MLNNNINHPEHYRNAATKAAFYALINAYHHENYRLLGLVNNAVDRFLDIVQAHHAAKPVLDIAYKVNHASSGTVFIDSDATDAFFLEAFGK